MSKKSSNQGLRLLMGAGSIIGFIGGWAILGQTGNTYTVQATDSAIVATAPATSVPAASPSVLTNNSSAINAAAVATAVPTRTVVQITTQTTTTSATRTTRLKTGGS